LEDISAHLMPLDFGDDIDVDLLISRRDAYEYVSEFPHTVATNYGTVGGRDFTIEQRSSKHPVSRYNLQNDKRGVKNGLDGLISKFHMMEKREQSYGIELENDPLILLQHKMESHVLLKKNIDIKTIIRRGVRLDYLLKRKYNLLDFVILKTTYQDLLMLGLSASLWKANSNLLPFADTIQTFGLKFFNVYTEICRQQLEDFVLLQLDVKEMKLLNVSTSLLLDIGMDKHVLGALPRISMTDWCKSFGLTYNHLVFLGITTKDIQTTIGWSANILKDENFKQHFRELFQTDVEKLDQHRKIR